MKGQPSRPKYRFGSCVQLELDFIPHQEQRYETLGDWVHTPDGAKFTLHISQMRNRYSEIAVALHEMVEALLCDLEQIGAKEVDEWDFKFLERHPKNEPGDDPLAPYHLQHKIATRVEQAFVMAVGMTWLEHELNCAQAVRSA
jgi:hypothetical protein